MANKCALIAVYKDYVMTQSYTRNLKEHHANWNIHLSNPDCEYIMTIWNDKIMRRKISAKD